MPLQYLHFCIVLIPESRCVQNVKTTKYFKSAIFAVWFLGEHVGSSHDPLLL